MKAAAAEHYRFAGAFPGRTVTAMRDCRRICTLSPCIATPNDESMESIVEPVLARCTNDGVTLPEPPPDSELSVALEPGGSAASYMGWFGGAKSAMATSAATLSASSFVSV